MTFDIDTFESHDQSMTATVCENAQLFGATPERGEFDPREVWDRDEAIGAVGEAFAHPRRERRPRRLPARRRARAPALGHRQRLRRTGPQTRPLRRPAHSRAPRPASRPGRHRGQVPRARADDRAGRRTSATAATPSSRCATRPPNTTTPRPETSGARGAGQPHQPDRRADLRRHRCARLHPREERTARPRRTCRAGRWSPSPAARTCADPNAIVRRLDQTRAKYDDLVHRPRRRPRHRPPRRPVGREQRRRPGRVQARLDPPRTRRSLPAQRRDAQPAAQGPHRVRGQRHHGQPRRQGEGARHPGAARLTRNAITRRVAPPDRAPGRAARLSRFARTLSPEPALAFASRAALRAARSAAAPPLVVGTNISSIRFVTSRPRGDIPGMNVPASTVLAC